MQPELEEIEQTETETSRSPSGIPPMLSLTWEVLQVSKNFLVLEKSFKKLRFQIKIPLIFCNKHKQCMQNYSLNF